MENRNIQPKQYLVHESNIEKLEKKLTTIMNKCNKYDVSFNYEKVGETFLPDEDGLSTRYIIIETSGVVRHEDWVFVGTVDHRGEDGNIIRQYNLDVEVPKRFYYTDKICEHCNTKRSRNHTYIVYNEHTGEWKQVGKTCLKEFTRGLDAEDVARCLMWFEEIEAGYHCSSPSAVRYLPIQEVLLYAVECIKHFGYQKADSEYPTKERCYEYFKVYNNMPIGLASGIVANIRDTMNSIHFNPKTDANEDLVNNCIEYVLNSEDDSCYMHNLKVLCKSGYVTFSDFGLVVSIVPTYNKYVEKQNRIKKDQESYSSSKYVGNINERIDIPVESCECVYSRDTLYGVQYLYKFISLNGDVLMWSTGNCVDVEDVKSIKGTVKSHEEFRGVKQTFLTRCKVEIGRE